MEGVYRDAEAAIVCESADRTMPGNAAFACGMVNRMVSLEHILCIELYTALGAGAKACTFVRGSNVLLQSYAGFEYVRAAEAKVWFLNVVHSQ